MYRSNRGDIILDPFCGGFTTARTALRYDRNFVGFELNKNAYDVFLPTLDNVEVLDNPIPESPEPGELAKREKQRSKWKSNRDKNKELDSTLFD